MRPRTLIVGLAGAFALGLALTSTLYAALPIIPHLPRGTVYVVPMQISIADVCFTPDQDDPPVTNIAHVGVDGDGPYFAFWLKPGTPDPFMIAYRPRGMTANTVAQFGDGAIHAVEIYRKYYERWHRAAPGVNMFVFAASNRSWMPACTLVPPPPNPATLIQMVITAEEWAVSANGIFVLWDPVSACFEDYDFEYMPL